MNKCAILLREKNHLGRAFRIVQRAKRVHESYEKKLETESRRIGNDAISLQVCKERLEEARWRMRLEEARLFHVMGDTSLAIKSAKELVESQFRDDGTQSTTSAVYAEACIDVGRWVSQTRVETSTEVDKNYYEPLKKIMGNGSTSAHNEGNESGIYHDRLPASLKPIASDAYFTIANHFAKFWSGPIYLSPHTQSRWYRVRIYLKIS